MEELIDFDGHCIRATYTGLNKVASYTDKEGNETKYEYDCMNRLCKVKRSGTGENNESASEEEQNIGAKSQS